jgi:hypothetical protein
VTVGLALAPPQDSAFDFKADNLPAGTYDLKISGFGQNAVTTRRRPRSDS